MSKEIRIFDEQVARKPDRYPWTAKLIQAMWDNPWNASTFDFASDVQDFKVRMTQEEREMTVRTLSAIAQIEVSVKKYWSKLGDNLPHPSIIDMGLVMSAVEVVHNKSYEKLLDVLGMDKVFEDNLKLEIIANRVKYLNKHTHKYYSDSKKQFVYSLILFTLFVENVSLFSQFYIISWFRRYKNYLKDTSQQVKYVRFEETIHSIAGITLVNTIRKEYPDLFDEELEEKILHEAEQAFVAESKIVEWMVGEFKHESLNSDLLKEYVKDRINQSLDAIGFKKIFPIDTTLLEGAQWADEQTIGRTLTDFFDGKPVEYKRVKFTEDQVFGAERKVFTKK